MTLSIERKMMTETAARLVDKMKDDVTAWMWGGEVDIKARYGVAIEKAGTVPLLAELFLRFEDSMLAGWIHALAFVWKDLSFQGWKEVLYRISGHAPAIYQFVPFATEYLALNVTRIILEDTAVDEVGRDFAKHHFPKGGPEPGSEWVRERLGELGIDQRQLWHRLAAEGAPMKVNM